MISIATAAVVLLIGMALRLGDKRDDSEEVRHEMLEVIKDVDGYSQNASYLSDLVNRNHSEVFDITYRMGGRHTGSSFDAKHYIQLMFTRLHDAAARDGKSALASALGP